MTGGIRISALLLLLMFFGCLPQKQTNLTFEKMLVEYAVNPMNIDKQYSIFSWIIKSVVRNQRHSAYRIFVATDKLLFVNEKADLWDSEKIKSDNSVQIEYAGKPLQTGMKVHWKVQVWDENGKAKNDECDSVKFDSLLIKIILV